jgi:hypothetical protein
MTWHYRATAGRLSDGCGADTGPLPVRYRGTAFHSGLFATQVRRSPSPGRIAAAAAGGAAEGGSRAGRRRKFRTFVKNKKPRRRDSQGAAGSSSCYCLMLAGVWESPFCVPLPCLPAQRRRATVEGMARGRILLPGAALTGLFLAWYVGSPWWTLHRMDEAARAGDWKTLASTMDMDAVRKASEANAAAGLRGALQYAREAHSAQERESGLANAETFRQMARRGPAELEKEVADAIAFRPTELIAGSLWSEPRFERSGLDTFTIRRNATPSPGTFVFHRHGLGWKLDEVRWGWPEKLGLP